MSRRSRARSRWRARSPWRCIPCASCRAPIEQGGRQFAAPRMRISPCDRVSLFIFALRRAAFCFELPRGLEHRDAMPYVLQPSLPVFPLPRPRPRPDTKRRTSDTLPRRTYSRLEPTLGSGRTWRDAIQAHDLHLHRHARRRRCRLRLQHALAGPLDRQVHFRLYQLDQ